MNIELFMIVNLNLTLESVEILKEDSFYHTDKLDDLTLPEVFRR